MDTILLAFATSHPPPSAYRLPTPLATLAQNWCPPQKRSEMA